MVSFSVSWKEEKKPARILSLPLIARGFENLQTPLQLLKGIRRAMHTRTVNPPNLQRIMLLI